MMNRFIVLSFCILLTSTSCKEEAPPIPPNKMTKILTDLHIAETHAQMNPIDKGGYMVKNSDTLLWLYSKLYKKYNIDSASLKNAIQWYELHPEKFDEVYEKVLARLSILKVVGLDSTSRNVDSLSAPTKRDSLPSKFWRVLNPVPKDTL